MSNKEPSIEKFSEYRNQLTPFTAMCVNCVYFTQHYIRYSAEYYSAIDAGHCSRSRRRHRRAYDLCEKFVNRYYDEVEE